MRLIKLTAVALLGLGSMAVECEALEPEWSEPTQISGVNPWPDASCNDVCSLQGNLCLEQACSGSTVRVEADEIAAACDEALWAVVGDSESWSGAVECCCGSN